MDVDSPERLSLRPAPEILLGKLGLGVSMCRLGQPLHSMGRRLRAQSIFDDLKPSEVAFIPYLRAIEQVRKRDVEKRNKPFPGH